jgi:protein phosphatase
MDTANPREQIVMAMKIESYGLSDVGKTRDVNEDRFLIADLSKSVRIHHTNLGHDDQTRLFGQAQGQLFVVADGMGGHAAGDRASTVAVDSVVAYTLDYMRWFSRLTDDPEDDFLDDLKSAIEHCQSRILKEADVVERRDGMGTTVTAAYVAWPRLYVVHVGDSRCYLLRNAKLKQITTDHTVAQQLVEHGKLDPDKADESQWSHILWNVVGGDSKDLSPEVYKAPLQVNDTLVLCSDGLTKHVSDSEITSLLDNHSKAEDACRHLVDAANRAGGSDNITALIVRFVERGEPTSATKAESVLEEATKENDPYADTGPLLGTDTDSLWP